MGSAMTNNYYPEDCDTTGSECLQCVQRTAESVRALTPEPTAEWATGVFQRLYTHRACRLMEYSFVWACGAGGQETAPRCGAGTELVQIGYAAA